MLIEFEQTNGKPAWINPDQVSHLKPLPPDRTSVHLTDGEVVVVNMPMAAVAGRINGEPA